MTIYELEPGLVYEVVSGFADFKGRRFPTGLQIRFVEQHFLPYDGGHTVCFVEEPEASPPRQVTIYLQEERQREIVDRTEKYLRPLKSEH